MSLKNIKSDKPKIIKDISELMKKKKVINKENALKAQHDNNWEGVEDINLLDRTEMRKDRRPATGG